MERSTMFLHSLLVLLVAIQVTLACQCIPWTLEKSMCMPLTVVLARVSGGEPDMIKSVPYTRYEIDVQKIYKEEQNKLSLNNGIGSLLFPQNATDCGGILRDDEDYVIVGSVNSIGVLVSSRRFHIVEYRHIYHLQHYISILRGEINCTDI